MLRKPFKSFNFLISNALTFFLKNFEADGVERDEGISGDHVVSQQHHWIIQTSCLENTAKWWQQPEPHRFEAVKIWSSPVGAQLWVMYFLSLFDFLKSFADFVWKTWRLNTQGKFFFESAVIEFKASLFCTCCDWYKKFNFVSIVIDTHLRVSICRYEFQFWEKLISSGWGLQFGSSVHGWWVLEKCFVNDPASEF